MCKLNNLIKKYREYSNNHNEKEKTAVLNELKELVKKGESIPVEDNIKNSKVCFMLSCPGEKEMVADKPCAGKTGDNLTELLKILNKRNNPIFSSTDRYDYTIINASDKVHFKALDGKSEARVKEIKSQKNIDRIKGILEHLNIEYIILCGNKAQKIKKLIKDNDDKIKFIKIRHLGLQSLNRMGIDTSGDGDKIKKKLESIAEKLLKEIK